MIRQIGEITNTYGALEVKGEHGAYFWAIDDVGGGDWEQIPQYLYEALNRFQDEQEAKQ